VMIAFLDLFSNLKHAGLSSIFWRDFSKNGCQIISYLIDLESLHVPRLFQDLTRLTA
jgi:hypothetical protein